MADRAISDTLLSAIPRAKLSASLPPTIPPCYLVSTSWLDSGPSSMMTSSSLSFTARLLPLSVLVSFTSLPPPTCPCCSGLMFSPSSSLLSIYILLSFIFISIFVFMSCLYACTYSFTCFIHSSATSHTSAYLMPPALNKPNNKTNCLGSTERRKSGSNTYICTSPTRDIFIQLYSYFYPATHFPSNPSAFSLTCAA